MIRYEPHPNWLPDIVRATASDCNDLPTRSIGEMIRRQVHEIVGIEREGPPDTQPAMPQAYQKIR